MIYYNSQYNFGIHAEEGLILYNSRTGATILISESFSAELLALMTGARRLFDGDSFEKQTLADFVRNGFLVEDFRDELAEIEERYHQARGESPIAYTITTTMNCNLGCYYCYENRSGDRLEAKDIPVIIDDIRSTFRRSRKRSLHVDWFGGEPLLNFEFIEAASLQIQEFCAENGISYHASVVSNGTIWLRPVENFVARHKIRQIQISFDGLYQSHDKVRRYRKGFQTGQSSFEQAASLIDELLNCTKVDIRFNIDHRNKEEIYTFIDFMKNRGWFSKPYRPTLQPARVTAYTEKSSFLQSAQLSIEEFDAIRDEIRSKLESEISMDESEIPYGFPFPKNYVCAALSVESKVIGADMSIYRCALEVGERQLAAGHLGNSSEQMSRHQEWWTNFNPCRLRSCSRCSFLPVCLGGCAKRHFDNDQHALDEQSRFWRNNLVRMICSYLGYTPKDKTPLIESDQFRAGYEVGNHIVPHGR